MNLRALLALAGIALATTACAVWAADATPPAPAASDPARMERVLRDAANPMRMILEAAKLRPARTTVVVPQPVVATVPPPAAARPVAAAPVQAAPVPVRSPVVDAAPPLQPTASAALPPALTPAAAPLVPAEPPLALPTTPSPVTPPTPSPAPETAPATSVVERAVAALPSPAVTRAVEPAPASVPVVEQPLVLAQLVEPNWTERLIRRLKPTSRVTVAMLVQPDGSVRDVAVRSSTDKALEPAVLEAVSQWRFQPVARSRQHVVELVLNPPE